MKRLSYANVVATIALFIALGGVSYAALKLPKNSVGTKQIKASAITGSKIKAGAIGASDIAPGVIPAAQAPSPQQPAPAPIVTPMPQTIFWAIVANNGSLTASSGGVSAEIPAGRLPGSYVVRFSRDVSNCALVATIRNVEGGGSGYARATPDVTGGVFVGTRSDGGANAPLPFSLLVAC